MRVLLVAEDCNPNRDSTPGVAIQACKAIADHAEVTLATPIKNQVDIAPIGCGRAEVVYIDNSRVYEPLYRLATCLRKRAGWTSYVALRQESGSMIVNRCRMITWIPCEVCCRWEGNNFCN